MFMLSAVLLCGISADPKREIVGGAISQYLYGKLELGIFSKFLYEGLVQFLPEQFLQLEFFTISVADLMTGIF
jgi:hypothetical protein